MLKKSYNHKYSHDYCKVIPSGVVPYSEISKAEYLSVRSPTLYTGKRRSPWKSVLLITEVGRHPWRSSSPALCSAHSRVPYSRLLRNMSSQVLTILPAISLGIAVQHLTTLAVKQLSPMQFPAFQLVLTVPPVISLGIA